MSFLHCRSLFPEWCTTRTTRHHHNCFSSVSHRVSTKPFSILLVFFFQSPLPLNPHFTTSLTISYPIAPIAKIRKLLELKQGPTNMLTIKPQLTASWEGLGDINRNPDSQELTPLPIIFRVSHLNYGPNSVTHCFTSCLS